MYISYEGNSIYIYIFKKNIESSDSEKNNENKKFRNQLT